MGEIFQYIKRSVQEQVEARTLGFLGLLPFHIGMFLSIQIPGLTVVWEVTVKFLGPLISTSICTIGVCVLKTWYQEKGEEKVKNFLNSKKTDHDKEKRA
jgi:hypothetical protein